MSEWKARRFWTQTAVAPVAGGWELRLDDRPVRTPGKLPLVLPTQALAEAIAAEWDAQTDVITPVGMPLTRAANSAVEKVAPQFSGVAGMLAEYGGTDLLCYRADHPAELATRQAAGWDPLLEWARVELDAPLRVTTGVIPVTQDPGALARLRARLDGLSSWQLTAVHDLITIPGSLVLGLAVLHGRLDAAAAHALSRLDDEHQAAQWGRDPEADAAAAARLEGMLVAERLLRLLCGDRGAGHNA